MFLLILQNVFEILISKYFFLVGLRLFLLGFYKFLQHRQNLDLGSGYELLIYMILENFEIFINLNVEFFCFKLDSFIICLFFLIKLLWKYLLKLSSEKITWGCLWIYFWTLFFLIHPNINSLKYFIFIILWIFIYHLNFRNLFQILITLFVLFTFYIHI